MNRTVVVPFLAAASLSLVGSVACGDGTHGLANGVSGAAGAIGAGGQSAGGTAAGVSGASGIGNTPNSAGGASAAAGAGSGGTPPSGGAPSNGMGGTLAAGGTNAAGGGAGGGSASGGTAATGGGGAAGSAGTGGDATVTCPTTVLAPGETNEMIQVGTGAPRTYILHVPAKYTGKTAVPLVVDFHPILSTSSFERGNSGYAALSDQEGFIIAYPQGIDNAWNIGPCCTTSRTVDDLGFAKALVDKLKGQACIDPKRVYATGYSMGGGMSHYLACNAADVFATVTPSAFDLLTDAEEPCHPARPITVMSFRGTADPIVPYAGGASTPPNGLAVTIHFLGAVGTFQKWAMLDGCTDAPSPMDAKGCQTYSQCSAGVEVTLCTTQGGSHVTGDPQAGWAMMKKHPMP